MSNDRSADITARKLAKLWLDCARNFKAFDRSDYCDPFSDAYFEILDRSSCPAPPDMWWDFILAAMEHEHSDESLAYFAAGPMEDFLCLHGDSVIERVETEARRSRIFQRAVSGVWQNSMSEEVWARVQVLKARAVAAGNSLD